jgi:hypothetical protein
MAAITQRTKRRRASLQAADQHSPGTWSRSLNHPSRLALDVAACTSVELGGRLWMAEVDVEDNSALRLSITTMSDDSKGALKGVLAAHSHEALDREKEAWALGADIERLMEHSRKVWTGRSCCGVLLDCACRVVPVGRLCCDLLCTCN